MSKLLSEYSKLLDRKAAASAEAEKIELVKSVIDEEIKALKSIILSKVLASGKNKLRIAGWSLNIGTYTSTVIENMSEVPEDFFRIKREADLMKIKNAIKAGIHIKGVQLVKTKSLTIKRLEKKKK